MEMGQSRCDGCLFCRFEPRRERIEEKAGRRIDDFLVTEREPNVERFLAHARDKLNMQDAVRFCKTGDEGRLLAMNIRENGCSSQGEPLLIPGIATAPGMEDAKHRTVTMNHPHQTKHESSKRVLAKQCTLVIIV